MFKYVVFIVCLFFYHGFEVGVKKSAVSLILLLNTKLLVL